MIAAQSRLFREAMETAQNCGFKGSVLPRTSAGVSSGSSSSTSQKKAAWEFQSECPTWRTAEVFWAPMKAYLGTCLSSIRILLGLAYRVVMCLPRLSVVRSSRDSSQPSQHASGPARVYKVGRCYREAATGGCIQLPQSCRLSTDHPPLLGETRSSMRRYR